jgi:hypothetical protein
MISKASVKSLGIGLSIAGMSLPSITIVLMTLGVAGASVVTVLSRLPSIRVILSLGLPMPWFRSTSQKARLALVGAIP